MKKIIIIFFLLLNLSLFSEEIILFPNKIIPESFLIEKKNIYGINRIYDQNIKTSFSFGLISEVSQKIIFYFDDNVELTSFIIVNGFQEKKGFYKLNARANNIVLTTVDQNGNMNNFNYHVLDTTDKQKFSIDLLKNEKINKVYITFNFPGYKGEKYDDLCISEITFFGKKSDNLKNNYNSKVLNEYFKSLQFDYKNNYSLFFNKDIEYNFREGGLIKTKNNELLFKYINLFSEINDNNGIKGNYKVNNNFLLFYPNQILVSKGSGEDYKIRWQDLKTKEEIIFIIEQENCFIKLIPQKKYNILKPLMNYINEWKQVSKNAPKGEYVPIVIQ